MPTGTVLAQVPRAGTEVDEGSAVSIVVALPETETAAEESTSSAQGDTATQRLIVLLPISFRGRCGALAGAPALSVGSVYCVDSSGIELWVFEFASEPELQSSYAARHATLASAASMLALKAPLRRATAGCVDASCAPLPRRERRW